ncbi:MAG: SpoIIE family protein phosphatase [Acidobacteriales bacterium]|nr:SpoIIE family protein phosphatase [Terriglobales bacterium]
MHELTIHLPGGEVSTVALEGKRYVLGRSTSVELCYPDVAGLSRSHLAFEWNGASWTVADLGSKNGTFVNGAKLTAQHVLVPGDKITAGHLSIDFHGESTGASENTVMFVQPARDTASSTVATNLQQVLEHRDAESALKSTQHMDALVRAGRELASHRPLNELFEVILGLSIEAVHASRGVLMTVENGDLVVRANRGEGFRISAAVRDRVLNDKASLLVLDAQMEEAFRSQMSIVQQQVRSMIAVPLETGDKIIGLIYVDSPTLLAPFTKQDLGLLTVMANVAAIRIEHARLVQVEQAERMMAKDLEQAAEIQRRLLPEAPPAVPGLEVAGYNSPCRGVGGDYFDFFAYADGRAGLLVADVAGKGMPAAMMMSNLHSRVQILAEEPCNWAEMTSRLNRAVTKNSPENRFITFFFCLLNPSTGELQYCNAGHNQPFIVRGDRTVARLEVGGLPLGLFPHAEYEQKSATIHEGDVLVLFSDGVSEAPRPDDDEEFGEDRLAGIVQENSGAPVSEVISSVIRAVAEWTRGAPPADDITLVVARRKPGPRLGLESVL